MIRCQSLAVRCCGPPHILQKVEEVGTDGFWNDAALIVNFGSYCCGTCICLQLSFPAFCPLLAGLEMEMLQCPRSQVLLLMLLMLRVVQRLAHLLPIEPSDIDSVPAAQE